MNSIILSHKTALSALRQYRSNQVVNDSNNEYDFDDWLKRTSDDKTHVLVNDINQIHQSDTYHYHLLHKHHPRSSFYQVSSNIKITGPELLVIQMSKSLTFEKLCLLILELCGKYHIDPKIKQTVKNDLPLSNIDKMKKYTINFAKLNPRAHGIKTVKNALEFCENNSASPMESRLFIKLAGPRSKGFYGCKNLKFNQQVHIGYSSYKIAGQKTIIPDLSCVSKKIAIEYDSAYFHENIEQGQKDKRRRDALVSEGWKVRTIVPSQLKDPLVFDIIARNILKDLGQDYRIRGKDFAKKRNKAFTRLG